MGTPCVYILARQTRRHPVTSDTVTSNIVQLRVAAQGRLWSKDSLCRYRVHRLVWYGRYTDYGRSPVNSREGTRRNLTGSAEGQTLIQEENPLVGRMTTSVRAQDPDPADPRRFSKSSRPLNSSFPRRRGIQTSALRTNAIAIATGEVRIETPKPGLQ